MEWTKYEYLQCSSNKAIPEILSSPKTCTRLGKLIMTSNWWRLIKMLGRSAEIAQPTLNWSPNRTHTHMRVGRWVQDETRRVLRKRKRKTCKKIYFVWKRYYIISKQTSRVCVRWHLNKLNSMQVNELSGYNFFLPHTYKAAYDDLQ